MRKSIIIANWKSNMTKTQSVSWIEKVAAAKEILESKTVIVCPPFTLLDSVSETIEKLGLPFAIGSQDVSPFTKGAYTGAVNSEQIKEFATYTLIGHSERQRFFGETDEVLGKKVAMAKKAGLTPIYCISDENAIIPDGVELVAYEPVAAIGSGNPETPEEAERVAKSLREKGNYEILYGGSVTAENVSSYTKNGSLAGVLVGSVSLDPELFLSLIHNA